MSVEIPALIDVGDVAEWSASADVVVVGYGMAGACAAIDAHQAGADVLIVERAGASGGTSALSAGQIYLGGGTPVQEATGHIDSVADMAAYLEAVTPQPDHDKIRLYCEGSVDHFSWLEAQGLAVERTFYGGKAVFQPGTEGLMWTGNEKVWPYREQARPVPRGHKFAAPGETGGARAMQVLTKRVEQLGIAVAYEAAVVALIAERGRVVGVRTRTAGEVQDIAASAVVLAAGGYVMNRDMLAAYTPRLASGFVPLGNPHDDGLGIRLGMSAGGAVTHMDGAMMTASFYPPADLLKGIIVNAQGERFVAEDSYHGRTAGFVMQQPDARAYLILDAETTAWPELPLAPFIDGWETIAEMERALGIPDGRLERTLNEYNRHAAHGEDPAMHKHRDWVQPLDQGPWSAFDLSLGKATYVGFTLGGLRTSVNGEVLDSDSSVVPGLYAAGACASNIAQDCVGYSSGTCLGEASFFGRRAGGHAASASKVGRLRGALR